MNLLDRYIFKGVLVTCLGAVALFAFVLMLGNAVRDLLGYLLTGQLSAAMTGQLVLLLVPFAISYALPMGVLCGVLLVLGRISADSEITAMRSAGLSLARIARPVLIVGVLGAAATLYVNFKSMPWARVEYHRRKADAIRSDPLRLIVPKTFLREFKEAVVYVESKNGEVLQGVWVYQLNANSSAFRIYRARQAHVRYDETSNELLVTLIEPQVEFRDADPEDFALPPIVGRFGQSEVIRLSLDRLLGVQTQSQKLQWMTYQELRAEAARIAATEARPDQAGQQARDLMKVSMTIHEKVNLALAVFSFALVGVPLGIRVSRRETSANLGIATLLALGYYMVSVMVGWLDKLPEFRPDLLLWLPNAIFLSIGFWLFRRTDRI